LVLKALDPDWIRIGIHPEMLELDPDPDEMNADPDPHPDPLVRGMDPRNRIHTKIS
jgi:hypothetical protein